MNYELDGRVAIVTGAAGGIGRATALLFARSGARVVVADMADDAGEETVRLIGEAGGEAIYRHCDVSDRAQAEALVAAAVERFGRLDFAHNNAGINSIGADEWEPEQFARSLAVNLNGVMLGMRAQIPAMLASGGGAIVNTASINGLVGNGRQPAYTAGKHGVVGLTRSAALRHAREGIRVNCVCPGVIETAMVAQAVAAPQVRATIEAMTPMGRMGRPEEVAAAVVWLCSDQASFVTGHALVIDGGATVQ